MLVLNTAVSKIENELDISGTSHGRVAGFWLVDICPNVAFVSSPVTDRPKRNLNIDSEDSRKCLSASESDNIWRCNPYP